MTKSEQIAAINEAYNKTIAEVNRRREYRWKNYYDCIDDYAVCGICEKADCMEENSAARYRDIRIEEVNNNGTHREVSSKYVLLDMSDNIAADTVVNGKFGPFWVTNNDTCVSVPRKISTLTKKGYKLALLEISYDCIVREVKIDGKIRNSSMKLVETKVTPLNEIPEYIPTGTPYCEYQYENFFKVA